ncbi:toll/interleukin-1 receptor domain-containing protein [Paraburkholderia aromaticivorans]|uniref:toll/interleukin-1 receptor domain-containing protein n=1 Tax=Paraburkholderia aromaticivorans TaxID=2026199 RepID=UPI00145613AC|nr:toll/interleukin-1 receptor domain-containing protein [Paraburkholderia aromaticivorans]
MALVTGLDVFISYAHADNEVPEGAGTKFGWVTALARNLNIGPGVLKKDLFIDHRLRPGDVFSDDLVEMVCASRLLVILLSQNYVDSAWCGKELEHFVSSHSDDPAKPADVFVVELAPYEELTGVPANVENLRKRLIHAKFWHQPIDAASPILAGFPTPLESGPESQQHYWRVLNELRGAIDLRFREQQRGHASSAAQSRTTPSGPPAMVQVVKPPLGIILLADVTDDLEAARNAVKVALEPEGISVLPDGDYIGLSAEEFDACIAKDLKRSELFVQLLSPAAGRKARGFVAPLPQLQFQRAETAAIAIMQWCEHLPHVGQISDPAHAKLFETKFLRATNLATFTSEVVERLRKVKEETAKEEEVRAQQTTELAENRSRPVRKCVFLDDLASESSLKDRVRAILKGEHWDIRSLPPSAPLGANGVDIKELLKPCLAGITIYADRAKYATVYNRLVFFLNQVAEGSLPVARWGVYLESGSVASEFGIESDDVVQFSEHGLVEFVRGLSR